MIKTPATAGVLLANVESRVSMDTETKKRTPPGTPKYHRLTNEKRTIIEALREKAGRSLPLKTALLA